MTTHKLKILDLFSGIGGFSYAAEKIVGGFKTTQFVEIDPYCQSVLRKNFPNVPIHDDIKTFTGKPGQFDVFTAGFPCQDLSVAGRQKGIGEGTRSGLFYEIIRLLGEIQPRFVLFENVRNLLSHEKGTTFQEILFQIAKAGYDAEWSVISAKDVGACHKRERLWIIAYPNGNRIQGRIQRGLSREWEILSEESKRSEMGSEVERCSQTFTDSNSNGSSTSERFRINGETNSGSQERENQVSKLERSSKSRSSKVIQRLTEIKWEHRENQLDPNWERYLSKPTLRRGDDGLSNRVLRLKALGNSIVPACAAIPLQRIRDLYSLV